MSTLYLYMNFSKLSWYKSETWRILSNLKILLALDVLLLKVMYFTIRFCSTCRITVLYARPQSIMQYCKCEWKRLPNVCRTQLRPFWRSHTKNRSSCSFSLYEKICGQKVHKNFSGRFEEIRAKIPCTPKNLPALTPMYPSLIDRFGRDPRPVVLKVVDIDPRSQYSHGVEWGSLNGPSVIRIF